MRAQRSAPTESGAKLAGRLLRWGAVAATALMVMTSTAQGRELPVDARGCSWLEVAELKRLTKLELASAGAEPAKLTVDFACAAKDVTIGIENAGKGIRVERMVTDACCDHVEPERLLGLLAAGLFRAAQTILTEAKPSTSSGAADAYGQGGGTGEQPTPAAAEPIVPFVVKPATAATAPTATATMPTPAPTFPPPAPPPAAPATAPATAANAPPVLPLASPPGGDVGQDADPGPFHHELGLAGIGRLNNLADVLTTFGLRLQYRYWPWEQVGFGALLEGGAGSVVHPGGVVDARVLHIGGTAAWRLLRAPPFSLLAELMAAATIVQMEGSASAVDFEADSIAGMTANIGLGLAPGLSSGRSRLALPLETGVLIRAPRGTIDEHEQVQLDGFWVGAAVSVTLGWGDIEDHAAATARRPAP